MIQHHVDVSKLNCCNCGGALVQTGYCNIWVSIGADRTVLKVQFILITRHKELWTNTTQTQISLRAGISVLDRSDTEKKAQLLHSSGHSELH